MDGASFVSRHNLLFIDYEVMTRKVINLNNYVCNKYDWYVVSQSVWDDMKDQNPRLRKWINPPDVAPLAAFFVFDAERKGWTWSRPLENCYGFLITYYANPNLIIMTGSEPGGTEEMTHDPQMQSPGMIPVDWNIPWLADLDNVFSQMLDDLGLGIPTWVAYLVLGTVIYIKVK